MTGSMLMLRSTALGRESFAGKFAGMTPKEIRGSPVQYPMRPPPDDALDHELMRAVSGRDGRAFERLVERHYEWALVFADRMLGARHEAEDLVQTAFLRVWQGAARWEPNARFSTWLYRVLYNLCMDRFRARGAIDTHPIDGDVVETLADATPDSEERVSAKQRDARVRLALAGLPARQRAALVLCYYEERSQAEAAALLGVSEGALESLLSRGPRELAQMAAGRDAMRESPWT
jgi:RNA polymerase sigma-70 factor (ECF subfamily)